jgi:hypothetical protein
MLVCGDFLRSAFRRGGAAALPSVPGLTLAPRGVRADFGDGNLGIHLAEWTLHHYFQPVKPRG